MTSSSADTPSIPTPSHPLPPSVSSPTEIAPNGTMLTNALKLALKAIENKQVEKATQAMTFLARFVPSLTEDEQQALDHLTDLGERRSEAENNRLGTLLKRQHTPVLPQDTSVLSLREISHSIETIAGHRKSPLRSNPEFQRLRTFVTHLMYQVRE